MDEFVSRARDALGDVLGARARLQHFRRAPGLCQQRANEPRLRQSEFEIGRDSRPGLGAASSSCSYAAAAAGRSAIQQGAAIIPALAFMFASTNLVIELGIILWILMGWQFLLAEFVGSVVLIRARWLFSRFVMPKSVRTRCGNTLRKKAAMQVVITVATTSTRLRIALVRQASTSTSTRKAGQEGVANAFVMDLDDALERSARRFSHRRFHRNARAARHGGKHSISPKRTAAACV